uniref:PAX-interacting protein 1 n=1 Tax=Timema tahoe TaxID=61484 RepID=A0A7R9FGC4_9NEOP|nr:unnamed protein product [Timema tahoe]
MGKIVLEPNVRYQLQSKTDLVFANVRATYIKTSDEESASCPFTLELTSGFEIPATQSPKTQNEAKLIEESFDEDSSIILPSQDVKPQLKVFHIPSLQSFKSNKTSVVSKNTHTIKTQSGSKNVFQEKLESNNTEETDQRNQPEYGSKTPKMVFDEGKQTDSSFDDDDDDDDDDDSIFNAPTQITDNIFNEPTQVTDNNTASTSNVKPGESSKTISARDWDDSLFDEATQIIEEKRMVSCENLQDNILCENIPNSCKPVEKKIKQGLSKNHSNLVTNNDSLDHSLLEGDEEMFTLTAIKEGLQSVSRSEECTLKNLTCGSPSDTTLEISSTKKNNTDFENQPTLIYEPSSSGENKHSNIHKNYQVDDSDSEIFAAETQVFDSIDEVYAFNVKHASTPINHTVVKVSAQYKKEKLDNLYSEKETDPDIHNASTQFFPCNDVDKHVQNIKTETNNIVDTSAQILNQAEHDEDIFSAATQVIDICNDKLEINKMCYVEDSIRSEKINRNTLEVTNSNANEEIDSGSETDPDDILSAPTQNIVVHDSCEDVMGRNASACSKNIDFIPLNSRKNVKVHVKTNKISNQTNENETTPDVELNIRQTSKQLVIPEAKSAITELVTQVVESTLDDPILRNSKKKHYVDLSFGGDKFSTHSSRLNKSFDGGDSGDETDPDNIFESPTQIISDKETNTLDIKLQKKEYGTLKEAPNYKINETNPDLELHIGHTSNQLMVPKVQSNTSELATQVIGTSIKDLYLKNAAGNKNSDLFFKNNISSTHSRLNTSLKCDDSGEETDPDNIFDSPTQIISDKETNTIMLQKKEVGTVEEAPNQNINKTTSDVKSNMKQTSKQQLTPVVQTDITELATQVIISSLDDPTQNTHEVTPYFESNMKQTSKHQLTTDVPINTTKLDTQVIVSSLDDSTQITHESTSDFESNTKQTSKQQLTPEVQSDITELATQVIVSSLDDSTQITHESTSDFESNTKQSSKQQLTPEVQSDITELATQVIVSSLYDSTQITHEATSDFESNTKQTSKQQLTPEIQSDITELATQVIVSSLDDSTQITPEVQSDTTELATQVIVSSSDDTTQNIHKTYPIFHLNMTQTLKFQPDPKAQTDITNFTTQVIKTSQSISSIQNGREKQNVALSIEGNVFENDPLNNSTEGNDLSGLENTFDSHAQMISDKECNKTSSDLAQRNVKLDEERTTQRGIDTNPTTELNNQIPKQLMSTEVKINKLDMAAQFVPICQEGLNHLDAKGEKSVYLSLPNESSPCISSSKKSTVAREKTDSNNILEPPAQIITVNKLYNKVDGKLLENISREDCDESRNRSKIILQNLHSSIIKESYISLVDLKYLKENVLPRKETFPNRASEAPTQILTPHKVQQLSELSPPTLESSTESLDALKVSPQLQSHFKPTTLTKSSEKETIICSSDKISLVNNHDKKERDLKSELQEKIKFLNISPNLITHKLNLPSTDNSDCLNEKPPIIDRSATVANSSVDVDALKINHLKHNEIDKIEESKVMKLVTADTEPFQYSGSSWKTLRTYSRKYRSIDIDEDIDADIDERLLGTPEKPDSPSLILPTSQDIREASLTVRRLVTPPDSDASDSEHYNPVIKTSFCSHKAVKKLSLDFEDSESCMKKPGSKNILEKETSPYKTRNGDFQESQKKVELEFQVGRRNKLRTYPGHKNAIKSSPPIAIDDANSIKPINETKTLKPELGECSPNVQDSPSLGTSFKKQIKRKQRSKQKKQVSTTCSTKGKVNSKKSPKRIAQVMSETCSEQTLEETESRPSRSRKMTWKALDMASTNFATRTSSQDLAGRHLRSESLSSDSVYKDSEISLRNSPTSATKSKKSESNDTKKSLSKIRSMKSLTESSKDNSIKPSSSTTTNINTNGSGVKRKIVNTNKIDDINVTTKRTRIEPRSKQRDNSSSNSKASSPFKGKKPNNTPQKVKTSAQGLPNKTYNNKSDRTEHVLEADKTANKDKVTPKRQTTMHEFSFRSSNISAKSLVDRESSLSTQATTGIGAAGKGRSNTKSPHKLTPQIDHSITRSVSQVRKSKRCSVKSEDINYQENKNLLLQNKSKKMVMKAEHNKMSVIIDISDDDNDPAESNNITQVQKKVVRRKNLVESNTSNANNTTRQARSRGLNRTEQTNNVKNKSCEVKVKESVEEDETTLQNSLSTSVGRKKTLRTSKVSSTNPTSSSFNQNTQSSQSEQNSESVHESQNSVGWNQEGSWRGRVRKRTNIFEEAGSYASLAGRGKRHTRGAASSSEERLPTPPKQRRPFYGQPGHRGNNASSRSSTLCKTSPINVLFTGLNDEQFKIQSEIVYRLGGTVVEEPEKCTVLVVDRVRRTYKFLSAAARGLPIVSPNWLKNCQKQGHFVGTKSFILQDKESEKKFKFQLTETLLSSAESPLLAGYSVLVTSKVLPPPKEIKGIVESCGGSYLSRAPARWPDNSFVISCAADKAQLNKLKNCKRPIVSAEVLLSGVLQHKLDLITYKL